MDRNGQDTLLWEGKLKQQLSHRGHPHRVPTAQPGRVHLVHGTNLHRGSVYKERSMFEQVPASLNCKFTCREHWNYLELDSVNICARQMLRQGRVVGTAESPSPLHCLQMLHGMPEEGWCNPHPHAAARGPQQAPQVTQERRLELRGFTMAACWLQILSG